MAESAKTLAWRYAVGAGPFQVSTAPGQGEALLRERLAQVADETSDRVTMSSDYAPITPGMDGLRGSSFREWRDADVEGRTRDQQK